MAPVDAATLPNPTFSVNPTTENPTTPPIPTLSVNPTTPPIPTLSVNPTTPPIPTLSVNPTTAANAASPAV